MSHKCIDANYANGPHHTPADNLLQSGQLPALQEPSVNPKESELAKVLSALRLKQARERRNLMQALGKREQYHSERLSRIKKH